MSSGAKIAALVADGMDPKAAAMSLGLSPKSAHKLMARAGLRAGPIKDRDFGIRVLVAMVRNGVPPEKAAEEAGYSPAGVYVLLRRAGVRKIGGQWK